MSDCFDHEADAWDDICFNEERYMDEDAEFDGYFGPKRRGSRRSGYRPTPFHPDPLYYHTRVKFAGIKAETDKAYLFELSKTKGVPKWVPKSCCRRLEKEEDGSGHVYIWRPATFGLYDFD